MKLADRVKICREKIGLSQERVAELLGVSQPSYQRLEKGGVKNPKHLNEIAEIYHTSPEWLKFGVGTPPEYLNVPLIPEGKVPLIPWNKVTAWYGIYDFEGLIKATSFSTGGAVGQPLVNIEYISFPDKKNNKVFALRVKGDSMIPQSTGRRAFLEGEIIIIDPEKTPKNMDYVIALQEGSQEALFKQYVIDGSNQYLRPLNPQYPLIVLNEKINICGVVVAHLDVLI